MYKYKETKEKWLNNNRAKVNARRRELHRIKQNVKMQGKYCLLCEIRMEENGIGTRGLYCKDCNERNHTKVQRHMWRRYYYNTLKPRLQHGRTARTVQ